MVDGFVHRPDFSFVLCGYFGGRLVECVYVVATVGAAWSQPRFLISCMYRKLQRPLLSAPNHWASLVDFFCDVAEAYRVSRSGASDEIETDAVG